MKQSYGLAKLSILLKMTMILHNYIMLISLKVLPLIQLNPQTSFMQLFYTNFGFKWSLAYLFTPYHIGTENYTQRRTI